MADRFIALPDFLFTARAREEQPVEPADAVPLVETVPGLGEAAAEARRFRAAVRDAVDVAVRTLLCDIAADVLARELELAPADLDAIVAGACARYANERIVCVRVHPDEAANVGSANVAVVCDPALRRGDALLEVCSGTIDLSLGVRLADVLERNVS